MRLLGMKEKIKKKKCWMNEEKSGLFNRIYYSKPISDEWLSVNYDTGSDWHVGYYLKIITSYYQLFREKASHFNKKWWGLSYKSQRALLR